MSFFKKRAHSGSSKNKHGEVEKSEDSQGSFLGELPSKSKSFHSPADFKHEVNHSTPNISFNNDIPTFDDTPPPVNASQSVPSGSIANRTSFVLTSESKEIMDTISSLPNIPPSDKGLHDFDRQSKLSVISDDTSILSDDYDKAACNLLRVNVLAARGIKGTSLLGTSDPFCKIKFFGQKGRTRVLRKTVDPVWREGFSFKMPDNLDESVFLEIKVYSEINPTRAQELGCLEVTMDEIYEDRLRAKSWRKLTHHEDGINSGSINIQSYIYHGLAGKLKKKVKSQTLLGSTENNLLTPTQEKEATELDTCAIDDELLPVDNNDTKDWQVWIELYGGRNIQSRKLKVQTDRFPEIEFQLKNVHNQPSHSCRSSWSTNAYAPIWNERFVINLESSSHTLRIIVRSVSKNTVFPDFIIGYINLPLSSLPYVEEGAYVSPQWRALNGDSSKGEVLISAYMVPFSPKNVEVAALRFDPEKISLNPEGSNSLFTRYNSQFSKLRVSIMSGKDIKLPGGLLMKAIRKGLGRPRVKGQIVYSKEIQQTNLGTALPNPIWDQSERHLLFDIKDKEQDVLHLTMEIGGLNVHTVAIAYVDIPAASARAVKKGMAPQDIEPVWVQLKSMETQEIIGQLLVRIAYMSNEYYQSYVEKYTEDSVVLTSTLSEEKSYIGQLRIKIHGAKSLRPRIANSLCDAFIIINYMNFWRRTKTMKKTQRPEWDEEFTFPVLDQAHYVYIYLFDQTGNYCIGMCMFSPSQIEANQKIDSWHNLVKTSKKNIFKIGALMRLSVELEVPNYVNLLKTYIDPIAQPDRQNEMELKAELTTHKIEKDLYNAIVNLQECREFTIFIVRSNVKRIMAIIEHFQHAAVVFDAIAEWHDPAVTINISVIYIMLCLNSDLVIPVLSLTFSAYLFYHYPSRPQISNTLPQRQLPQLLRELMDEDDRLHELEEEESEKFKNPIKQLQSIIKTIQESMLLVQDKIAMIATLLESANNVIRWADPRATGIIAFLTLGLGLLLLSFVQTKYFMIIVGLFVLRHPVLRTPGSVPANFMSHIPTHDREIALLLN